MTKLTVVSLSPSRKFKFDSGNQWSAFFSYIERITASSRFLKLLIDCLFNFGMLLKLVELSL